MSSSALTYDKLLAIKSAKALLVQADKITSQLYHHYSLLKVEDSLVDEYEKERALLLKEKEDVEAKITECLRDINEIDVVIARKEADRKSLEKENLQLETKFFTSLKDEIDLLRSEIGMERLPTLQEEVDMNMASYLEKRRGEWRDSRISNSSKIGKNRNQVF
eukprot:Nk52_evm19s215 gene=Nk52_evmTU19s215